MQSLDVISVNLWQILISLANLLILFLIIKKFLFQPVKKVLAERQGEIEGRYSAARDAEQEAQSSKKQWEEQLRGAKDEADFILTDAVDNAKFRGEKIVEDAKAKADSILRQAEAEAALEYQKAYAKIRHEIVEVSGALTEKILGREMDTKDHHALIDSFLEEIGDGNDPNQ